MALRHDGPGRPPGEVVASFFEVGHNLEAFQEKKKVEDETKDEARAEDR